MNQIAHVLSALGWSQPQLAAHLGVSQQTVSRWLRTGAVANGAARRMLDQLESDLASGKVAPAPQPQQPEARP